MKYNKIKCSSGFSLIEYTVWLALCAITLPAVATIAIAFVQSCRKIAQTERALTAIIAIETLWSRDIEMAPRDIGQWHRGTPTELIWHTSTGDIGWHSSNGSLLRTQGIFSNHANRWIKKSTVTVLEKQANITFIITSKKYIDSIVLSIKLPDTDHEYHCVARPLNTFWRY